MDPGYCALAIMLGIWIWPELAGALFLTCR